MEHLDAISALVTGGASGLGEATARALHGRGAHVIIADRNTDRGAALAAELGARAEFCATDVCSEDQVLAAIARAEAARPLRVAVNCAGIGGIARTLDRDGSPHPLEGFRRVLEVNLVGTFNVLRLAAAAMAKHEPVAGGSERGVVINTASVAAFDGQIGQAAYASSKAAIAGMTLPVARDLSVVGVRVMTIAPGTFDTPMLAGLPDKARSALAAAIPFPRRLGDPREYARLVLAIVENEYLNGTVIRLDGSLRMAPK